jgi:spore maturation protein CgeB
MNMKIKLFYHSIVSDWNHGNAHFLRGIVSALQEDNHSVTVYEPENGWSLNNLVKDQGIQAVNDFTRIFPRHIPQYYRLKDFDAAGILSDADLVLVHEWNDPELIKKIGDYRASSNHFKLLFHDTHHRSVTKPEEMMKYDLQHYDSVLVFGEVIRKIYNAGGWAENVWTWHEAADTTVFYPWQTAEKEGDLVWIGNWGDNERSEEIREFIIDPVRELGLKAVFYGVRYPVHAREMLKKNDIEYRGWLPNHKVPEIFSKFRVTVHVPRRPYVEKLPGIPTIRPFEAMACGIPLVVSKWKNAENLFTRGRDYLQGDDGNEMKACLKKILHDKIATEKLADHALNTIRSRHTCRHRVQELYQILKTIPLEKKLQTSN